MAQWDNLPHYGMPLPIPDAAHVGLSLTSKVSHGLLFTHEKYDEYLEVVKYRVLDGKEQEIAVMDDALKYYIFRVSGGHIGAVFAPLRMAGAASVCQVFFFISIPQTDHPTEGTEAKFCAEADISFRFQHCLDRRQLLQRDIGTWRSIPQWYALHQVPFCQPPHDAQYLVA